MRLPGAIAAALLCLAACGSNVNNKESVQKALEKHLASRSGLDMSLMDMEVTSVAFRDREATANVVFRAKGSNDPQSRMSMSYTLERRGDDWVVKDKREGGASPHGGGTPQGGGGLPPGHPPVEKD